MDRLKNPEVVDLPMGRKPVLPAEVEDSIAEMLKYCSTTGYPLSEKELRELLFQYCEKARITHPFSTDERAAGRDWWKGFLTRHPSISVRKGENVSFARARGMNRETVNGWFDRLRVVLVDSGALDLPHLVWNMDETGIVTVPNRKGKVISIKGVKNQPVIVADER